MSLTCLPAIYYSTSTISGCFSGLIAYGVQKHLDGHRGTAAWRWLFLIEGVPSIAVGIGIWLLLPPFPDKVKKHWLFNEEEIKLAVNRSKGEDAYCLPEVHPSGIQD
jgi:hypothetical protein